jgi:hypothetical protein
VRHRAPELLEGGLTLYELSSAMSLLTLSVALKVLVAAQRAVQRYRRATPQSHHLSPSSRNQLGTTMPSDSESGSESSSSEEERRREEPRKGECHPWCIARGCLNPTCNSLHCSTTHQYVVLRVALWSASPCSDTIHGQEILEGIIGLMITKDRSDCRLAALSSCTLMTHTYS